MDIYHYLHTFEKKRGALAQSECLSQAPKQIQKIYQDYYIGKERDFLELLHYMKERQNINKVLESIQQLRMNRLVQMTTEKIIFLAEQVEPIKAPIQSKDEVTSQSLENLSAISELFESKRTGVIH